MEQDDQKTDKQKEKNNAVTSISFERADLERYKAHAKSEGLAFSKMIKAFFEQDIEDKQECKSSPEKIIERIRMKQRRMLLVNEHRLQNLKIDDLITE